MRSARRDRKEKKRQKLADDMTCEEVLRTSSLKRKNGEERDMVNGRDGNSDRAVALAVTSSRAVVGLKGNRQGRKKNQSQRIHSKVWIGSKKLVRIRSER